ncbi:MAG TPA: hypothetical protein VMW04_02815 [Patescibacteria group bacterium]|nr:hypothetical protein [Patescibacteria group bacterium]
MPLVTTPSGYTVSSTLLFVKDFWLPISGLTGLSFLVFRGFSRMAKNAARVGEIEKDIDDLKEDVNYIRGKVGSIEKFLKSYLFLGSTSSTNRFLHYKSPIKLTKQGEKLLLESSFLTIYKRNREKFLKLVSSHNIKLKYEAQEAAFMAIVEMASDPLLKPVKKYAFTSGKNMADVLRVCGVYLRDELIKEFDLQE